MISWHLFGFYKDKIKIGKKISILFDLKIKRKPNISKHIFRVLSLNNLNKKGQNRSNTKIKSIAFAQHSD